jgi:hypothetical protein
MFVEGRIETTSFHEIFHLQVIFGLDTTGEHRLLDQRIASETNCPVARLPSSVEQRNQKLPRHRKSFPLVKWIGAADELYRTSLKT